MAEDVKPRFKFLTTDDFMKLSAPERLAYLNKAIADLQRATGNALRVNSIVVRVR